MPPHLVRRHYYVKNTWRGLETGCHVVTAHSLHASCCSSQQPKYDYLRYHLPFPEARGLDPMMGVQSGQWSEGIIFWPRKKCCHLDNVLPSEDEGISKNLLVYSQVG